MNYFSKKTRGSALVYAVVVMAVVGTISLGVAQISLRKTQTSAQSVDGIQAYYLSESAVEIGFTSRNIVGGLATRIPQNTPDGQAGEAATMVMRATLNPIFTSPDLNFSYLADPRTERVGPNDKTLEFRVYHFTNFILQSTGYFGQSSVPLSAQIGAPGDITLPIYIAP